MGRSPNKKGLASVPKSEVILMDAKPAQKPFPGDSGAIGHTVTENALSQMDESFLKAEDAVGDEKHAGTPKA